MKILGRTLDSLILLDGALIALIIFLGGFEWHVLGVKISCRSVANPALAFIVLVVSRFFLIIGLKNSFTFLTALLVSSLLAEFVLRLVPIPLSLPVLKDIMEPSPILGYSMIPGLRDVHIQTNSQGLRDREHPWEKDTGVKRILGIGDSFTFGYGVPVKDCYLKQLENLLNRGTEKWEVINAGVSGYNMWQHLAYFRHYGWKYGADIVIIGVYFDDFNGDPYPGVLNANQKRYRTLSFLRLANVARNGIDLLRFKFRYLFGASWLRSIEERRRYISNTENRSILSGNASSEIYEKFESRLKELGRLADSQGSKVLVLMIPDVVQLNHPELQAVNHIVRSASKRSDAAFLDVTPRFERADNIKGLYLLPYDAHTSPKGNRIIAEEIEKEIRTMTEMNVDGNV